MPSSSRRTQRRAAPPRSNVSATAPRNSKSFQMSDLFDLPFEEEAEPESPGPKDPAYESSDVRRAGPVDPPSAIRRVLSVTELTVRVRDILEEKFFEVWVEGELSGC